MINKMNKKDVQINSSDIFPGYLDYCVSKIHYGERKEPFPSYEEWKPIIQQQFDAFDVKQKKDIQSWLNKLKTNKEQFTIDTISEVTKTFLYWGLCDIAVFKIGELAKTFSDVMSAELQILATNSRELRAAKNGIFDVKTIEVVDAPILCSIRSTEEVIDIASKYGSEATEKSLEIVKSAGKDLVKEEGSIYGAVNAVARFEEGCEGVWMKVDASDLKKIGQRSLQSDIRQISGNKKDAFNFFRAQVESFAERANGVFVGVDKNDVIFTYRAVSKSGPPTIDINGIKGIRKIKFIE
jgi:hypothetical protein